MVRESVLFVGEVGAWIGIYIHIKDRIGKRIKCCSLCRGNSKLWTVYETESWMEQLRARFVAAHH